MKKSVLENADELNIINTQTGTKTLFIMKSMAKMAKYHYLVKYV